MHSSFALPYSSCIEATYFNFCTAIPWSMEKKINNFGYSRSFTLKKIFRLFVAQYYKIENHFSVGDMPSSCDDHVMEYPAQTPNIGMGIVNYSSSKPWSSCPWLTGPFRLLRGRRPSSRFPIFVEAAKCAALLIAISLDSDEVLGQVLLQACWHWVDLT